MQHTAQAASGAAGQRLAPAKILDISSIIKKLSSVKEANALPRGAVVGDLHGGLTFTDRVAAALEARSDNGWREVQMPDCTIWTIITVDR